MATNYNVKIKDKLLRFDTTKDDVIVWLLPFAQTPNAPFEIHKTSYGDGHTVTIQPASGSKDFLLPNGANVVLDDTNNTAIIRIPANGSSPAFVSMGGVSSGGGGGTTNVPAPDVRISGPAEILFRDNNQLEVDVEWLPASNATAVNFQAVAVYLEDPDISSGPNMPLDGTALLDGTHQASGQWAPARKDDSSPAAGEAGGTAVLLLDATTGGTAAVRNIRIYLAAFGPYSQPILVRANQPESDAEHHGRDRPGTIELPERHGMGVQCHRPTGGGRNRLQPARPAVLSHLYLHAARSVDSATQRGESVRRMPHRVRPGGFEREPDLPRRGYRPERAGGAIADGLQVSRLLHGGWRESSSAPTSARRTTPARSGVTSIRWSKG